MPDRRMKFFDDAMEMDPHSMACIAATIADQYGTVQGFQDACAELASRAYTTMKAVPSKVPATNEELKESAWKWAMNALMIDLQVRGLRKGRLACVYMGAAQVGVAVLVSSGTKN